MNSKIVFYSLKLLCGLKKLKGVKMKRFSKFLVAGAVIAGSAVSSFAASPSITMPTPDYTNFYAGVGVVIAVSLVVMLARRLKGFFR